MRYAPHNPGAIPLQPAWTRPKSRKPTPCQPLPSSAHGPRPGDKGPAYTGLGPTAYARLMRIAKEAGK